MAKFAYKMQGILNVKEKLETQAKNEFAIAAAELRTQEEILKELIARRDGYEEDLASLYMDNLDLPKIIETQDAIELIKYQIRMQKLRVKSAEKNLEEKRVILQEAMQERKTHDKLKEKEFEQFLKDEADAENKEIDEIVSYRFGQKLKE